MRARRATRAVPTGAWRPHGSPMRLAILVSGLSICAVAPAPAQMRPAAVTRHPAQAGSRTPAGQAPVQPPRPNPFLRADLDRYLLTGAVVGALTGLTYGLVHES